MAKAHGASVYQVALAWLLARSPVMLLPIPGMSSVAHLEENVAAGKLKLAQEELDAQRLGKLNGPNAPATDAFAPGERRISMAP